ncbi:hypothetical protein PS906_04088 [Pseudomonas fluorescens]|nr:hypothetical protein PS906_04088 [Pseudomonas fluorescens]
MPAMTASASPSKTASIPFASKLAPTGIASMPHVPANPLNLWELACQRWRPLPHRPKPGRSHSRASSLPQGSPPCRTFRPTHRDRIHPALSCQPTEPVGAGLPAMAASASPSKTASIPFASKLAPTGIASIPHFPAKQLNPWERACSRRRQLLHHPATAQAVSVLARWSPEVIPTGPRYCRRRRSRGTGSHPVSRCCPRHSGSSS